MEPMKYAISYVIYNEDRSRFLVVQRPENDPDLPDVWGLPAGSVGERESYVKPVARSGREKLGVDLQIAYFIGCGNIERRDYILHMEVYEAKIASGEPTVPQPAKGVTQYKALKWGTSDDLIEAAQKGSLCCRLYLDSVNRKWEFNF